MWSCKGRLEREDKGGGARRGKGGRGCWRGRGGGGRALGGCTKVGRRMLALLGFWGDSSVGKAIGNACAKMGEICASRSPRNGEPC